MITLEHWSQSRPAAGSDTLWNSHPLRTEPCILDCLPQLCAKLELLPWSLLHPLPVTPIATAPSSSSPTLEATASCRCRPADPQGGCASALLIYRGTQGGVGSQVRQLRPGMVR